MNFLNIIIRLKIVAIIYIKQWGIRIASRNPIPAPALGEDESNELIILYVKYEILKIIYIIDESNDNLIASFLVI